MSLVTLGAEPQPSLAWSFDSSNVDYITSLSPSSTVQPGPAQLQGAAALVTNAPTSNTAVSFDGSTGYMNLGTTGPTTFNTNSSNLFVESWIYVTSGTSRIYGRGASIPTAVSYDFTFRVSSSVLGIANGASTVTGPGTVSSGTWYHCALSITTTGLTTVFLNGQAGTPTTITMSYNSTYPTFIGAMTNQYMNGYIRDLRVVQGGTVPTASFTPAAAPFSYATPTYVANMGATVFTLLGQFITYKGGRNGNAINIQGGPQGGTTSAYLTYTPSTPVSVTNGCTISMWLNIQVPSSGQAFFFYGNTSTGNGIRLSYVNSSLLCQFYYYGSEATYINYPNVSVNTWYHYTCVIDSTGLTSIYINGKFFNSETTYVTNPTVMGSMLVGAPPYTPGQFNGLFEDLRIYRTALSPTQILSVYTQGADLATKFGTLPQPVYAWNFEGTTAPYIGSLSAAVVTGTPTYTAGKYGQCIRIPNTSGASPTSNVSWTLPSISSANFTVTSWCKAQTLSTGNPQIIAITGINPESDVRVAFQAGASGQIGVAYNFNLGIFIGPNSSSAYAPGDWIHIAATITEGAGVSTLTVYVNGDYIGDASSAVSNTRTFTKLTIGSFCNGLFNNAFDGFIDDLRIYSSTLSSAQIKTIYAAQGAPSPVRGNMTNAVGTVSAKIYGTPNLSQLTTNARIGAFSLRSVNDLYAKVVNIRPVESLPNFSSGAFSIGSNIYQQTLSSDFTLNKLCYASGSSIFNTATTLPWMAFDSNTGSWWETTASLYSGTPGTTYTGTQTTTVGGTAYPGEWLQIRLSTPVVLASYSMYARNGFTYRAPYNFIIAGSNNGSTWVQVDSQSGINTWTDTYTPISFEVTSSTLYYYYRLIITAIKDGAGNQNVNLGQWTINGYNSAWNSDFYADRLGNLLTAPVTGETLATWLGSATGYVTTWYDQSGQGNHMSCSSIGIQPKIDPVNRWIDFKTSAYFDTSAAPTKGPVPYSNTSNYTVICRHASIGNANGGICGNGVNSASLSNNFRRNAAQYQHYWSANDMNGGTYAVGNSVTFKWDGTNRYIYSNGTLVTTQASSGWLQTTGANHLIGKTIIDVTMNGEMYNLFMFNAALSDADRNLVELLSY